MNYEKIIVELLGRIQVLEEKVEMLMEEKDKTMDKSDKDYVYDSLIDIQATVDDLVEYMEDDDSYEEEENKRNI